jgi:hypothetical protein
VERHILNCKESHNIGFGGTGNSKERGADSPAEDPVRQLEEVGLQFENSVEKMVRSRGVILYWHDFAEVQSIPSTLRGPAWYGC